MTDARHELSPADPARHAPSQARPENCEARAPDPTDRYMRILDELVDLGTALTKDLVADAREEIAARRAARAAVSVATPAKPAAVPQAEPDEPEPTPEERAGRDPSFLAFQRLTRAVRRAWRSRASFIRTGWTANRGS
jgi:hypothetical protein